MTKPQMPGPGFFSSVAYGIKSRGNYITPMHELFVGYGNYVMFRGTRKVCVVFDPVGVEYILKTNQKNFIKSDDMKQLRPVLGNGLLISEGDEWRSNRRTVAPEFQHKSLEAFFNIIRRHTEVMLAEWREHDDPVDMCPLLSKATYGIAGDCFFGTNLESTAQTIYRGIEVSSEVAVRKMISAFPAPYSWPLPSHLRMRRAVEEMDKVVYGIIDERLKNPRESMDVLSRLLKVGTLNRTQIRDEVMTLLLAGHETTANGLAWTLFLLGKHPSVQEQVRDEVKAVVAGEVPTFSELARLSYTKMVLEESMRIFPPVAAFGRKNLVADQLGGFDIEPETKINLVQWIVHRHPDFWEAPEEFRPERFAKPLPHPYAYFPFGGGARECIGRNMAMMEGVGMLAAMIRAFRFQLVNDNVKPRPMITVRPDPGVYMKMVPAQSFRRLQPESTLSH